MKKSVLAIIIFYFFLTPLHSEIIYLDPLPDSKLVSINNEIIIGINQSIDKNIINSDFEVFVTGSKSGNHTGKILLTSDSKKILFIPDNAFSYNENVSVIINSKNKLLNGIHKYTFITQPEKIHRDTSTLIKDEFQDNNIIQNENNPASQPLDFPQLTVTVSNNPAPGKIFLSNIPYDLGTSNTPYLIIAENSGIPFASIPVPSSSFDFKKQPNGNLTYFSQINDKFYELGVNYNKIDSFYCGNGYATDTHELRLLANGHALLIGDDSEHVNMSQIISGGNPNAIVIGIIIQELDENKNVVFQWRSWDHFNIIDAIHIYLLGPIVDYAHTNAIELDNDGTIMISSRNLEEITKINRANGNMVWRLGGVHNQFTFINDTLRFNFQHAVRRIANGNITLYDNGNYNTPSFSRAVEYSLDEVNKTATQVWQYRHSPDIFGSAMGYVQRLSNGNTLISWGAANPTLTEVTPSGETALEMTLPYHIFSYRTFKDDWNGNPTGVEPVSNTIPKSFRLDQNYPNPFNPETTIQFSIPNPSFVNITIFDASGRQVASLINDDYKAGTYRSNFDASHFSSGVYFYKLTAGSFIQTKKMILVK